MTAARRMLRPLFAALILGIAALAAKGVDAQSVRVQNGAAEWGYGWMFRHGGNCYVVMPRHVAGPDYLPRVTISTAAPVETDQANVVKPFWEGIDLALAVVDRGPLDARCSAALDDLSPTAVTRRAATALVLRIDPTGEERRIPVRVLDRGYLTFTAEVAEIGEVIMQGTSGAFAYADDRPIGMALTSDDPTRGQFMRSEEIALNLERFLSDQGGAFVRRTLGTGTDGDAPVPPSESFHLYDVSANLPPTLPQHGPENVTGDGLWIVRPTGLVELTVRVGNSAATAVRRLRMTAPPDGLYAVPKAIAVYLDAGVRGDRFRYWTGGEMRPDGVFDTGPLASRNARWVRVVIRSAWSEGEMAVDRIVVE